MPLKNKRGGTLLESIAQDYPEALRVFGANEWEGGVIHRLDSITSGLVIVARDQESYDELLKKQREGEIIKYYRATISQSRGIDSGFERSPFSLSDKTTITVSSYFRAFGEGRRAVRPTLSLSRSDSPTRYETKLRMTSHRSVDAVITRGFRHQIRAHLAWLGHPIIGDELYGGESGEFDLCSYRIVIPGYLDISL